MTVATALGDNSSIRLLHVISNMDSKQGGVSQAVKTMIVGLDAEAIQSEVVCLDSPDSPWNDTDSFPIHALGPAQNPWHYTSQLVPWLLDNLLRFNVVILHGLWLYQGYALHKALRHFKGLQPHQATPRFFVMPHGMLDPYFQHAEGRKLKAWRNWLYWHLVEGTVVNQADGLLFTCETERRLAHEPFSSYHPRRELVVGLGVETPPSYTSAMQEALAAQCPELQNRPYLLFLSRIHEKKGVNLLLAAYDNLVHPLTTTAALAQAGEDLTADAIQEPPVLVIAGPGLETAYGQRLYKAAKLANATILFPGMLSGNAKWGAFYGCEAFVLPSHQENFGIAVVEALACGKPVLISNQVNIWREIDAAGGGLVEEDSLAGTQRLLERWHALSGQQKELMGNHAQTVYRDRFAVHSAAKRMAEALQAQ